MFNLFMFHSNYINDIFLTKICVVLYFIQYTACASHPKKILKHKKKSNSTKNTHFLHIFNDQTLNRTTFLYSTHSFSCKITYFLHTINFCITHIKFYVKKKQEEYGVFFIYTTLTL